MSNEHISPEEYKHANYVWQAFNCHTLRDYLKLYFTSDLLQLADVFKNRRDRCLLDETYQLDRAHYVSPPQLSGNAMLKTTSVELDLITDPAIFEINDGKIRGGMSEISRKLAIANNKYLA